MQSIQEILVSFLLIVVTGIIMYYGQWFYGTLTEKETNK